MIRPPFAPETTFQHSPVIFGRDLGTGFRVSLPDARPGFNPAWLLHAAEVGERMPTGNVLRNTVFKPRSFEPGWDDGIFDESIVGMLWPNEAAWRLKLEFKRFSGFSPDELVTFKNVPVPAVGTTNIMSISQSVGGTRIMLREFSHYKFTSTASGAGGFTVENFQNRRRTAGKTAGHGSCALC